MKGGLAHSCTAADRGCPTLLLQGWVPRACTNEPDDRGLWQPHFGPSQRMGQPAELVNTPEFAKAQRERKKVEALFAELKNQIGLRRLRLRRLKFVREQFFLAATAQNIKRLVRFLSQGQRPTLAATT